MRIELLLASVLAFCLLLASCGSTDYELGDVTRAYCASTSPEARTTLRGLANAAGLSITDYCLTFGVPMEVLEAVRNEVSEGSVDDPETR